MPLRDAQINDEFLTYLGGGGRGTTLTCEIQIEPILGVPNAPLADEPPNRVGHFCRRQTAAGHTHQLPSVSSFFLTPSTLYSN